MKQLYIRKGNSSETKDIIIIGEESELGGRDLTGYKPSKGSSFEPLIKKDHYTGRTNLTYVHATPNIKLNTTKYSRDYNVHQFVKEYCTDLVTWDGETNTGRVRSREAFIVRSGNTQYVCDKLWERIEKEIHGGIPCRHIFIKRLFRFIFFVISIPFRIVWFILKLFFGKKKRRRHKRLFV